MVKTSHELEALESIKNKTTTPLFTQILTDSTVAGSGSIEASDYTRKRNGYLTFAIRSNVAPASSAVVIYYSYDNTTFNAIHSTMYEVNNYNSNLRVVVVKEGIIAPYVRIKIFNTGAESEVFNVWVTE